MRAVSGEGEAAFDYGGGGVRWLGCVVGVRRRWRFYVGEVIIFLNS